MKRNPIYVFEDLNSTGIYNVPMNGAVQISDVDGTMTPSIIQVIAKNGIGPMSTIAEFMSVEGNYTKPGSAGFVEKKDVGVAGGVPPLDIDVKIPSKYMPHIQLGRTYTAASEQEMIDLPAVEGDMCVRTDINSTFIKNNGFTGTVDDWTELLINIGGVQTVNGESGNVILDTDDVGEGAINKYYTQAAFDSSLALKGINNLVDVNTISPLPMSGNTLTWNGHTWSPAVIPYPVMSVANKTGNVQLNTDDVFEAGNLYYKEEYVSTYVNAIIDDTSAMGDTDKIWSADKLTNEFSYYMPIENPNARGMLSISENSEGTAILRVQKTDSVVKAIVEQAAFYFRDTVGNKSYGTYFDSVNSQVDFRANAITSLSFVEGFAPTSPFDPIEVSALTRKDYVDGEIQGLKADDNTFTGLNLFVQDIAITLGGLSAAGNISTQETLVTGTDANGDSSVMFNNGHATAESAYLTMDNTNDKFSVTKAGSTFDIVTTETYDVLDHVSLAGDNTFAGTNIFDLGVQVPENRGLVTTNLDSIIQYGLVTAHAFLPDGTVATTLGSIDGIVTIEGQIWDPILLKNDTSIQGLDATRNNPKNLISRSNDDSTYTSDVIVGDGDVKTAIRSVVGFEPVIRKGVYGGSTDYKIWSDEKQATAVNNIIGGTDDAAVNEAKINELLNSLRAAGIIAT